MVSVVLSSVITTVLGISLWGQETEAFSKFQIVFPNKGFATHIEPATPHIVKIQGTEPPQIDNTPPSVISTSPVNKATNVPLQPIIVITFSEPMQAPSLSTSTFKLKDNFNNIIPSKVTLSRTGQKVKTAAVIPLSPLLPSKLYSMTITTGVKDVAGNGMTAPLKWIFSTATSPPKATTTQPPTDTIPPTVISTNPANGGAGASLYITATFSEPVQSSTVNPTTFYVEYAGASIFGPYRLHGIVTLSADGKTAKFVSTEVVPTVNLVTITNGVKDLAGNALIPIKWYVTP